MMPLGRYFVFVGGLLLALLFLIDSYLPQTAARPAGADADRSIIRIHSARQWPSAVVFDTTQPLIASPPQAAWAEASPASTPPVRRPPHEALALAQTTDIPAAAAAYPAAPKHVKRKVRTARPDPSERVASSEPFGFRPFLPASW